VNNLEDIRKIRVRVFLSNATNSSSDLQLSSYFQSSVECANIAKYDNSHNITACYLNNSMKHYL